MTKKKFSKNNHYVPIWYQQKFLPDGKDKFYVKNLKIKKIQTPFGPKPGKWRAHRGTGESFIEEHLYTNFFENTKSDVIEKVFFGKIDLQGANHYSSLLTKNGLNHTRNKQALSAFINYMNAQRVRTPRMLQLYKNLIVQSSRQKKIDLTKAQTKNKQLELMIDLIKKYRIVWLESVWEIVSAKSSEIKFIISDNPVTIYNPKVFPGNKEYKQFQRFGMFEIGTRTLFPLNNNLCLILTNKEYVKNPNKNHRKCRKNPRLTGDTMFNTDSIKWGRSLNEIEVCQINQIIKINADRYIAGTDEKSLHPERYLTSTHYNKFDKILLPKPSRKHEFRFDGMHFIGNEKCLYGQNEFGEPIQKSILKEFHEQTRKWREIIHERDS